MTYMDSLKSIILFLPVIILFSSFVLAAPASITVKQGWNMIASPVEEGVPLSTLLSFCGKLDKYYDQYLWSWNASLQDTYAWYFPDTLPAYTGAWIYSNGDCNIPVTGTPVSQAHTSNLKAGWNLVSFDGRLSDFIGTCSGKMDEKLTHMDATAQGWTNPETLDSSKSAWVWVGADCRLERIMTTTTGPGQVTSSPDLSIVLSEISYIYPKPEKVLRKTGSFGFKKWCGIPCITSTVRAYEIDADKSIVKTDDGGAQDLSDIILTFNIRNEGLTTTTPFRVSLEVLKSDSSGWSYVQSKDVVLIDSSDSVQFKFVSDLYHGWDFNNPTFGKLYTNKPTLRVIVDYKNVIKESNEENNQAVVNLPIIEI